MIRLRLSTFYGKCTVITVTGILTGDDMERLLPYCKRRILFHGEGETFLSHSAAIVLADSDVLLVGTDADSSRRRLTRAAAPRAGARRNFRSGKPQSFRH